MRIVVLSSLVIFVLVLVCGCTQVRGAARCTASAASSAWNTVRGAARSATKPRETTCARISDEVYSHPCGGDNDIGRGGTGAFYVP
jgi:hypothetical protein